MATEGIELRGASAYSLDNKAATLIISSSLDDVIVEANGNEINISAEEGEKKLFIIPSGLVALTIRAEGYEPLLLEEYTFKKDRVYDLEVTIERLPHTIVEFSGKGNLVIRSQPEGAAVSIQGLDGEWKTPVTLYRIPAGSYTVTLSKNDFDTTVFSATVNGDSTTTLPVIPLQSRFGFLSVVYTPATRYYLNNIEFTNDEEMLFRLLCGEYQLDIHRPKYKPYTASIMILPGDTLYVRDELIPDFAYIDFSLLPSDAEIFLNNVAVQGRKVETVPAFHSVRTISSTYGDVVTRFILKPGETRVLEEKDFLGSGNLIVTSDVPAQLFVNDNLVPLGALKENIPPGRHLIRLTHDEHGEISRTITVRPNETRKFFVPMLPSRSTAMMLAIIPGAGQMYNGMTMKGLAYFSGFALSLAGAYYFKTDYDRQYDTYMSFVNEYNTSTDATRIQVLNSEIKSVYPKVQDKETLQNTAFGITGALFLWNIIDLFLFEPSSGYREREESITGLSIRTDPSSIALGLNVSF